MTHANGAGYNSGNRQGCLKGTRVDVCLQLEQWLKDGKNQQVFWLNGLAGTGKSTIAQTFAEICFANGDLGASFFCSRDFEDRSTLHTIFPTLALHLAYQYPQFQRELLKLLRTKLDVGRESLITQMEKLIVGPLRQLKSTPSLSLMLWMSARMRSLNLPFCLCSPNMWTRSPM